VFNGTNFGSELNKISVWYGLVDDPKRYACEVDPRTTDSLIVCRTQFGEGQGFTFLVDIAGQIVQGSDKYSCMYLYFLIIELIIIDGGTLQVCVVVFTVN